jgi:nitric oxide reductase NorD protein
MRTTNGWLRGAAARIARAFGRAPAPPPAPMLELEEVRRRLEILLAAVYGREIPIVAAKADARGKSAEPVAGSDGERIHLPPRLDASDGIDAALARYRVLAIGQAERMMRGTVSLAPPENEPLARDLYLLLESAAADASIAESIPGVRGALAAERASALAARPPLEGLKGADREVEAMLRRLLAGDAADPPADLAPGATPEESLARARALAERVRAAGRYRGVPAVAAWGRVVVIPGAARVIRMMPLTPLPATSSRYGRGVGGAGRSHDPRSSSIQVEDPFGKSTPQSAPDDPNASDAPAGSPQAEGASGGGASATQAPGGGAAKGAPAQGTNGAGQAEAVAYPEWDTFAGRYQPRAAWVRPRPAVEGDESWAAAVLAEHAALVRRLRERFERLRAQRQRLVRQRDGDELDLEACVRAFADRATGHSIDDRLYAEVRPARRGLAICLLVDISGSTSEIVGRRRIIDIEKTSLLLTSQALDALGDLYAILSFCSVGPEDVRLRTLKDFGERNGAAVRRRIGALRPEGYTRLGAAMRHATALLARQQAGHRLLLILSDGKPNDQDHYQGRFGVEDSRQAIAEARASGVHPFCITIDRKGGAYLARIFGEPGHVVLGHPDQLPLALVKVVRQILANR